MRQAITCLIRVVPVIGQTVIIRIAGTAAHTTVGPDHVIIAAEDPACLCVIVVLEIVAMGWYLFGFERHRLQAAGATARL